MRAIAALCFFIFNAGCAVTRGVVQTSAGEVRTVDLDAAQSKTLQETLDALQNLPARAVVITREEHARESSFLQTFGFLFDGAEVLRWWRARIKQVELGDPWTVAVYGGGDRIVVREDFFGLSLIDRLASLIHEARHADAGGFRHVECPPSFGLGNKDACDATENGAYAFQAAFLFELYARNLIDGERAHRGWRHAKRRIL